MNAAPRALLAAWLCGLAMQPVTVALPPPASGADDPPAVSPDRLLLARTGAIVERAHRYLVTHQNPDGSFSAVRNDAASQAPVAVTALAALSLMAAGHLPDRGSHELAVRRAIDWLVERCRADGYITTDGDTTSRMHGHGYAVLALTQACGMESDDERRRQKLRDAIQRSVRLIEESQGESGGWWYDPVRQSSHEGSITVCMVQALRAARDIGFHVHGGTIERALRYLDRSQDPATGRFRYAINDPRTSWALTAAALATLNALGDYQSERLEAGIAALVAADPFAGRGTSLESFQDYGALYAAQAYWQWREPAVFERWWAAFVADCEERQRGDGSFFDGVYGSVYATAIVSLSLQVPSGWLPVFQR